MYPIISFEQYWRDRRASSDPVNQRRVFVATVDVGPRDPDPLRAYFVVGRVVRGEDGVNAGE